MIDEMQLTVQVNMSFQELDQVLTSKGLRKLNQKYQKDIFMIKNDESIDALADFEKLSHSIIIRDIENEFKGYLYEKSTYDIMTSSLKKQSIRVDLVDLEQGYHFLEALDYHKFLELNQELIEYANATNKICVSIINGLGVFVEIHSRHMNYFNGNTPSELRRILDYYVPNIMNNDYYVNKAMLMINKK